ncbi:unnamed protein product [Clonostachys byssicola]|uniref:Uncharacterized protein n=1 Tax=Clonostachys byssicola TaxID=160290 RepID=A0A9N9U3S4_9HYPO|nr:unnamed protein product [Clonostachys byssicola]
MTVVTQPEVFFFKPTNYVPNSQLPVLVYRKALPLPLEENLVREFLESNNWIHGGTWNAVPRHHFHPNTHECYGTSFQARLSSPNSRLSRVLRDDG